MALSENTCASLGERLFQNGKIFLLKTEKRGQFFSGSVHSNCNVSVALLSVGGEKLARWEQTFSGLVWWLSWFFVTML